METVLRKINRPVELNGERMTVEKLLQSVENGQELSLYLPALETQKLEQPCQEEKIVEREQEGLKVNRTYVIKVRQYMTKLSTPDFDFHDKWNNGVPMPFRIMKGTVIKETPGMVHMDCHVVPMKTDNCMRCGRRLTHPVSKLYGIGPECGGHAHINPFQTEEELYAALDSLKQKLEQITWTGWIIKSAIEEYEEVL